MSKRKCHDAAAATIVLLAERFPNCFRLHDPRRPLKTGIHHDIHLALEGAITPRELGSALRSYSRMLKGASRIGLDGQPAGAAVTGEEAQHARGTSSPPLRRSGGQRHW
jgi:sRNA-binding protein